jgi:hypothetical protein
MPVDMGKAHETPAWGCNCMAWKPGVPKPMVALRALAKARDVEVWGFRHDPRAGDYHFRVKTHHPGDEVHEYEVTYDPAGQGGFCKHTAACADQWAGGWLRAASGAARLVLEDLDRSEKENKRLRREVARWQKKSTKS